MRFATSVERITELGMDCVRSAGGKRRRKMCLYQVKKVIKEPTNKVVEAWGAFLGAK